MSERRRPSGGPDRAGNADEDLSLQEAADLLGVHYMTAYRYVRTGRLPARQIGGTWHVRRSSLEAIAPPVAAGRAKRASAASLAHYERRLEGYLVKGDQAEAWRLAQQALTSACTPEDLYLEVLGPALRRVGDDWAAGTVSVAEEHRASALMSRLVGRLGPLLVRRGPTRGSVVIGAPEGDFHALASALVGDVLRGRGFSVIDLGANTPAVSFCEAMTESDRLVATGIVVSAPIADAAIEATIGAMKVASDVPLLLGGCAIRDDAHARRLGADAGTSTARAAVEWFEAAPRPVRRRT